MKKVTFLIALTAVVFAGCSNDNPMLPEDCDNGDGSNTGLVSPDIRATVDSPDNPQSPMTGILEVFPCNAGTSIYYGNYVSDVLSPLPGRYPIKDGNVFDGPTRPISLPVGTYNMVYWGTPKYEEPTFSNPIVVQSPLTIGTDLSQGSFSLRINSPDTTYYPALDLVFAVKPANIGTDELNAAMKRKVAGLKVIVKDKNNGILSSSISTMNIHIGGIAEMLNMFTAAPINQTKTVGFPLTLSADGTQMSNATVMLFPSAISPLFQLIITLKNGTVKTFKQNLSAPLKANTRLTLTLTLGDIFTEEGTGNFTIDNWQEESETIDVPVLD